MSLLSPSPYHSNWPPQEIYDDLPNVKDSSTQSPILQAGDTCYLSGPGHRNMWVCADATQGDALWLPTDGRLWSYDADYALDQIDVTSPVMSAGITTPTISFDATSRQIVLEAADASTTNAFVIWRIKEKIPFLHIKKLFVRNSGVFGLPLPVGNCQAGHAVLMDPIFGNAVIFAAGPGASGIQLSRINASVAETPSAIGSGLGGFIQEMVLRHLFMYRNPSADPVFVTEFEMFDIMMADKVFALVASGQLPAWDSSWASADLDPSQNGVCLFVTNEVGNGPFKMTIAQLDFFVPAL